MLSKKINSRSKGASGEREISNILNKELGIETKRNLQQTREGGHDLLELHPFAPEVKRCEREEIDKWWKQTVKQAEIVKRWPILFFRASRKPWSVVVSVGLFECDTPGLDYKTFFADPAILRLETFIKLYKVHYG